MGVEAVGAYFEALRQAKAGEGRDGRMTRNELAAKLHDELGGGVNYNAVHRMETGEYEIKGPMLVALLKVLGGSIGDVQMLYLKPGAQPRDGLLRAEAYLRGERREEEVADEVARLFAGLSEQQRDMVLNELAARTRSPLLAAIRSLWSKPGR